MNEPEETIVGSRESDKLLVGKERVSLPIENAVFGNSRSNNETIPAIQTALAFEAGARHESTNYHGSTDRLFLARSGLTFVSQYLNGACISGSMFKGLSGGKSIIQYPDLGE